MEADSSGLYNLLYKSDERYKGYWLLESPLAAISIIVGYWLFVNSIGRAFMKNREPLNVDKLMLVYNALQSLANGYLVYEGVFILKSDDYDIFCSEGNHQSKEFETNLKNLTYVYVLLKFSDLTDTIFMVLRKNYHQISFLHVYHHLLMAVGSWFVGRYIPTAELVFFAFLNCTVHVIMYGYYFITAWKPELKKNLWWKKHLTQMQLVQFFLIILHHITALLNPNCKYSKTFLMFFCSQNVLMIYLFGKFYYKTYINPKEKSKKLPKPIENLKQKVK